MKINELGEILDEIPELRKIVEDPVVQNLIEPLGIKETRAILVALGRWQYSVADLVNIEDSRWLVLRGLGPTTLARIKIALKSIPVPASVSQDNRLAAMQEDGKFIAWLEKYLPDWKSEYSGTLLGLHDAFNAGRDCQRR